VSEAHSLHRSLDESFLRHLRLKHLLLFRHVCGLQTLRKASVASHMTQPAATKLIRELEEMLGAPLFVRERQGMKLTVHGDLVHRHVEILLGDIGTMRAEINLLSSGASGQIRLGVVPSLMPALLTQSITQTLEIRPQLRFTIQEAATTGLLEKLYRNELDLILGRVVNAAQAKLLNVQPVYSESFVVACATKHALARRRGVTWKALSAEKWVLPPSDTPMRHLVDNLFIQNKSVKPEATVEAR
jgi:DNA-binding transcriptional LysR family regulator